MSMRDGGEEVGRFRAPTALEEGRMVSEVRPAGLRTFVGRERGDRVRWGPIWAGAVAALTTYVLLEMALLAVEAFDADVDVAGDLPDGALLTIAAAAIAFFVGGLVAGATMASRESGDGILHGVLVWATTIAAFVVLGLLGIRLALGTLGHALTRLDAEAGAAGDALRDAAGSSALMLVATLVAAAVGALVGTKLWPPRRDDDTINLRDGADESRVAVRG